MAVCASTLAAGAAAGGAHASDPPQRRKMPVQKQESPLTRSPELKKLSRTLASRPITLDEAVQMALAVNPNLAQAGENLLFFQGKVKEAKSGFLPTVSLNPGGQFIRHIVTPAYGIEATVPLDISSLITAATQQAQFQEVNARLEINRIRNEIVYSVQNGFYTALREQALVRVAEENLTNSQERLRDAEARYKARAVAYIDVVRAQTDVANAQKQVIEAKSNVSNALAKLSNDIGIDVTSPISITDKGAVTRPPGQAPPPATLVIPKPNEMPEMKPPAVPAFPIPTSTDPVTAETIDLGPLFRSDLTDALVTRPEIMQADAVIAAAKKGILLANRSELPSLALGVGYFDHRSQTGTKVDEPQAYVGLNIPIFDGGLARARTQEAKANVLSAITSKRQAVDSITLDVQRAYLALIQAEEQVGVASQALVQAHAAFDLARVRYNTGVSSGAGISPLIEVSDAQVALTLAEQNEVNALYDYNSARAQVARSIGKFAFTGMNDKSGAMPSPPPVESDGPKMR